MIRKPFIAGNWKLNKNIKETKELSKTIADSVKSKGSLDSVDISIIPVFTSLSAAQEIISSRFSSDQKIKLGAQDLSQFKSGAYTGEISAEMLQEIGVDLVLIGHSERREIFKEDDSIINAKFKRALEAGLEVILCCGESLETRKSGKTDEWIESQIQSAFQGLSVDASRVSIAYEPIWAIGTGETCESDEANRVIKLIRHKLSSILGQEQASKMRILYGGSVKPSTIAEQMSKSDIDGALVGGASLNPEDFLAIIENTCKQFSAA
jgi:triosephosphate isomerase (TIM)